jgi:hypothetical protein
MTLKERTEWEAEVKFSFSEAVLHHRKMDPRRRAFDSIKEDIIMSYLSDVQELITFNPQKANDLVNRVKFIMISCGPGTVNNHEYNHYGRRHAIDYSGF